jgi:hypothetical protein
VSDATSAGDPIQRIAAAIRDVGAHARYARRYRALATSVAEPVFDRVLEIGSEVRRAARGTNPESAIAEALHELQALEARCTAGVDHVRGTEAYRDTAASFRAGAVDRVASRAPEVFTDVAPYAPGHAVYWPVSLSAGRSGPHFIPPEECAARIVRIASDGIAAPETPADLGGDEAITPVVLSDDLDPFESPVALAFDPKALPGPLCRLESDGTVLFYGARLLGTPRVQCLATVEDEWWRTRPDFYRDYLNGLQRALQAAGFPTALTIVG